MRRAMRIMADEGDRAGALQLYALLARHLACDLDLAPSPETARLAEEIRGPRSDASPQPLTITTALSDTARAADLPLVSPSGLPAAPARPMTMPPGRARARSRRLAAALALLAVPVVGAIVARSDLGTRRPRIVIEPLANMSADTSLDTFARLATQRIESSLQPLPVEEVATAMSLGGGRSLARALRASFLVSGVVTARGDTIRVATTVTDLRTGQVARHGRVVAAPAGASLELLPPLQTEVHGIVSSLLRAPR